VLEVGSSTKFLTISTNPTLWTLFGSHKELGGASVFQMKVKALLTRVAKIGWFAKVIGNIWTRKYQKRGLPHIHLLFIFPQE
jgi:hypothetical protein